MARQLYITTVLTSLKASFHVHFLALLSVLNALYTFARKRHYRLFETPIDSRPQTPSAHRVHVNSSPISSSPLRYLSSIIASTTAESRAHPDATRDVWEIAVWDPTPLCLRLFCLFSPGHVLVYSLFLPTTQRDPRPSVTVATTLLLATLLSVQLFLLQHQFSQQSKDSRLIHKEVLNEYDTKYVRPALNKPVRDAGTQVVAATATPGSSATPEVLTYTPTTYVNRGFHTHPNTNYAPLYDPDNLAVRPQQRQTTQSLSRAISTPNFRAPDPGPRADLLSPNRPRQQQQPSSTVRQSTGSMTDGGSFGIHSHAYSPLKRTAGRATDFGSPVPSGLQGAFRRQGSPLKRSSGLNGVAQSREGANGARDRSVGASSGSSLAHRGSHIGGDNER